MRASDIPIVEPFDAIGWHLVDIRDVSKGERAVALEIPVEAMRDFYPPEIYCKSRIAKRLDDHAGRRGGDLDPGRHSCRFYEQGADYEPLQFVVFDGREIVGLWQWIGIKLRGGGRRIKVSAGWYPSFRGLSTRQLVSRSVDLVEHFGRNALPMRDGRMFDLVAANAPLFTQFGRPETRLIRFVLAELNSRAGLDVAIKQRHGEGFVEVRFLKTPVIRPPGRGGPISRG